MEMAERPVMSPSVMRRQIHGSSLSTARTRVEGASGEREPVPNARRYSAALGSGAALGRVAKAATARTRVLAATPSVAVTAGLIGAPRP